MPVYKNAKAKTNPWYFQFENSSTGKRKQILKRGFRTKKEAELALAEARTKFAKGELLQPSQLLYKDFLEQYLDAKKLKVKQRTLENYTWLIEKYIIPELGNIPIGKLTADRIEAFYGELLRKKTLASENISKIHTLIHESLNRAVRRELVNKNAAALVDRPRIAKTQITVWDKQQSNAFLHAVREHRFYVAFLLALTTGMRQSEILGLRWQDVDLDTDKLSVVQALSHNGKEFSDLKTASSARMIVLPAETATALRKRKSQAKEEALVFGRTLQPSDLVVSTSVGTKVIPRNLMRTYYQLLMKVDVPKIRFHDLRHTHATLLLKANVNPKIVAERLGHANVRITLDRYSHLMPDMQKEAADLFAKAFFG